MAKKTRTEYSILNILTGLGGYALNTLLGFVCRVIFVRCLTDEYLGINGLFSNILSMLSLAELGIGSAIIYALYKPLAEHDEEKIASLMRYYAKAYRIIGCVVAVFGLMMIPFLDFVIQDAPQIKENLYLIYVIFLFNSASGYFFSYRSSLLTAAQESYLVVGVNYLFTIVQSAVQIGFLLLTREYLGYLIIQSVCTLGYNIVISWIAARRYPCITKKEVAPLPAQERRDLTGNIRALTIWKLSGLLVNNTDNIIITYFSGLAAVGFASNYTLFSGLLNTLLNQLFSGITASVGNFNATESNEKKLELFRTINLTNFWLFGWAALGIFLVSSDLVELCYGAHYVLPTAIPFVIALNFYMVGMQNAVWTYKNTLGLFRKGRYLLLVTAAINLVASIVLGNLWGLFGILFATAIARGLTNTWYDPYAVFKYGMGISPKYYFKLYLQYAAVIFGCGLICWKLCAGMTMILPLRILAKCVICTIVPNGVFWLLYHKKPEFQYLQRLALRVLKLFSRFLHFGVR